MILLKFGGIKMPKTYEEKESEDVEEPDDPEKESDDDISSDDDEF